LLGKVNLILPWSEVPWASSIILCSLGEIEKPEEVVGND
jgi:hypothetical protein